MFACCESTIGEPCGHRLGGAAVATLRKLREDVGERLRVAHVFTDSRESYSDYVVEAHRRGNVRQIANVTIYWDGRTYATRHVNVRTSTDYADWSHVVRVLGGTADDYFSGIKFAPAPGE